MLCGRPVAPPRVALAARRDGKGSRNGGGNDIGERQKDCESKKSKSKKSKGRGRGGAMAKRHGVNNALHAKW
eukprot:CAMPEP_0206450026 /NCGR_PEP_ID=MMETSP0324_2-20121206/18461_1 /ASSEMBLY_ACC=CAM_ASM_000836 /TAXON_ID=2866 /ORGANISM="Crypthecodinium cohnii, Strain Seligo" /LENGTH=71 /DNA_ID=CAMNT_0053919559 /DNA_START=428 /DNA_END=640 /DNA_ORIENTATION=+